MKAHILATTAAAALLSACSTIPGADMETATDAGVSSAIPEATGYFAADSTLPMHAPDFTKIAEDDYIPAFEQGMAIHKAEIEAIKANPEAPNFENTIVALEKSGRMLGRVATVFYALTGANTTDRLDAIDTEIGPKLTAHSDSISLDPVLFARVKAVYDNRAAMTMTPEDAKLLENTYEGMVHAGALLTDAQRERVKAINSQLTTLTTDFSQKARSAMADQPVIFDSAADLAGLSDADIKAAADFAAEKGHAGKYAIALQNTTQQPLLPTMTNRAAREKLFKASFHRADGRMAVDTRLLVADIAELRAEKANMFGAPDWATYAMWDRMAEKPKTALDFMEQMVPALANTQRSEAAMLNEAIKKDGGNYSVQPWDW